MCADSPLTLEGHRVSEAFNGAVAELQESEVKLAVVYVSEEKDLVKELNALDHASIRLYLDGDKNSPLVCPGMCILLNSPKTSSMMEHIKGRLNNQLPN